MGADRHQRAMEILATALGLAGDQRRDFLAASCGDDADLRREVEELLAEESPSIDSFLEKPLGPAATLPDRPGGEPCMPERIGPFAVLSELGRGGMGTVFMAEQSTPVQRRVALKVVSAEIFDDQARRRFELERQTLARLVHPNIARLYEAASTADGIPFFAMELVEGRSITAFCDQESLDVPSRVSLFATVCDAVAHAHEKGVLHRDLKPSNILVAEVGGHPVPKIIDFGIAKAIDRPLGAAPTMTGDRLVGTPAYMSPEAVEDPSSVDTRSDVYSLGVILYELLVGTHPLGKADDGLITLLRRIVEEEPVRPTTCWRSLDEATRLETAKRRGTSGPGLARLLGGDLDWIVLKALARKREDRYASPAELAADLRRHLHHEPVDARPPSLSYQMSRFVRRHRAGVAAGVIAAVASVVGVAGLLLGLVRAQEEADAARKALQETQQVSSFLVRLFEVSDPWKAGSDEITVRELLDRGSEELLSGLEDQPLARARFMQTIGDVYERLGRFDTAEQFHSQALSLRETHLPGGSAEIGESLLALARDRRHLGRHDEAEKLIERCLETTELAFGSDALETAEVLSEYAGLFDDQGLFDRSEEVYRRVLAIRERVQGHQHPAVAGTLVNLSLAAHRQGRYDDARELAQQAVAIYEAADSEHLDLGSAHNLLCIIAKRQRRLDEAVEHCTAALKIRERRLGPDHYLVAQSLGNLGTVHRLRGDMGLAEEALKRALEIYVEGLGADHKLVAIPLNNLADAYAEQGRYDEARELFERSLDIKVTSYGAQHASVGQALFNLGVVALKQGRLDDARSFFERALDLHRETLGPDHPDVARDLLGLAGTVAELGRGDESESLLKRALVILETAHGREHPVFQVAFSDYLKLLRGTGREDEAARLEAGGPITEHGG